MSDTPEDLAKEFGVDFGKSSPNTMNVESLAKEFGYDPNYKEPEKPKLSFWQGLKNDPTVLGTIKKIGVGALRGAKDVIDTGAEGLAYTLGSKEDYENVVNQNKIGREEFNKEYPPSDGVLPNSTEIGRMGGQIAATLPIMPTRAFNAISVASKALPIAGKSAPLANRLVAASGIGALGGGILGGATSSQNDKSLAENVGEGVITGAIGGPLIEGATQLGKNVGSKIVGKISTNRAALAERAAQLGIDLKATQVSDNPTLKKYDQISGMLPFSGAQGITDNQISQFTRAVSKTFGKDVTEITPQVVQQARKDIGGNMEAFYKASNVNADKTLQNGFQRIINEVDANLSEAEKTPIFNNIINIADKVNSANVISGDAFNALVKYDGILSKLQKNSNPNIARYANEIRKELEDALTRSVSSIRKEELTNLRRQYKSVMTIKDLVENDPEGKVNPLKLMRKVTQAPGGKLGSGELGELADIGREFFINPADSGTPLGTYILNNIAPAIHNPVSAGAAAAGAFLHGAALTDLLSGGAGLALNRGVRSGLNSSLVRDAVIRAGKGSTFGNTDKAVKTLLPYSSEPLRITVGKSSKDEKQKLPVALK